MARSIPVFQDLPKGRAMAPNSKSHLGSSPLFRYAAASVAVLLAVEVPLVLVTEPKPIGVFVSIGLIEAMCAAFIVGVWSTPIAGRVAFRMAAGLLSLICIAPLVANVAIIFAPASNPFPVKDVNFAAMIPFFTLGLPCSWYATFGRFGSADICNSVRLRRRCRGDNPSKN